MQPTPSKAKAKSKGISASLQDTASEIQITYALTKASQPMFIMGEDFNITWCNEAYVGIRGIPHQNIVGSAPPFLKQTPRNVAEVNEIKKSIASGESWTTEFEFVSPVTGHQSSYQTIFTTLPKTPQGEKTCFVIQNDITEQKKKFNHLWKMANHDCLTGIANRGLFSSILEHSISQANRNQISLQVLFLDLDGFKQINDNFGHDAGDFVLIEVSKRIQSTIRDADFVARLGGDEFAIILIGTPSTRQALSVANKIINLINKPMVYKNQSILTVGVSIGISTYPIDGLTEKDLKLKADQAMYEAKKAGKNRVYTAKLTTEQKITTSVMSAA